MSIILWKLDRRRLFYIISDWLKKTLKNEILIQVLCIITVLIIYVICEFKLNGEIFNALTVFFVIDISNTERKSLSIKEKSHFYDSISIISRSLVCGFIAPLIYILFFGNGFGILYMLIYNLAFINKYNLIKIIYSILTIIPSMITEVFLYIIYVVRNKSLSIDYKGDYLGNMIKRPLLNIDILGAYIESVNFYYCFSNKDMHFVKSYGKYTNKIDSVCVKDYLSISYGICMLYFVLFYFLQKII